MAMISIWVEPDCFSLAASAAASGTTVAAEGAVAAADDGAVALELSGLASGAADEAAASCSGQRDATTDRSMFGSTRFAPAVASAPAAAAAELSGSGAAALIAAALWGGEFGARVRDRARHRHRRSRRRRIGGWRCVNGCVRWRGLRGCAQIPAMAVGGVFDAVIPMTASGSLVLRTGKAVVGRLCRGV